MAIFNSFLYVYQRVKSMIFPTSPQAGGQYLGTLLWIRCGLAARNALRICGGGVIHGKHMDFRHGEIIDD